MPIRLLLADNHPIVLDGVKQLFQLESDFEVVGHCARGKDVLPALLKWKPDVLVLAIRMPEHDGFAVLREMKARAIATRVVLFVATLSEKELLEAIRLDVRGVVLKEMAPRLLVECVRKVQMGGQCLEKASAGSALEHLVRHQPAGLESPSALTLREIEIVRMIASGLCNREIARRLFITEGTVKTHLHHIYEKLHLHGRLELSVYARDRGIT
jgi:two-component system nitrate/nitrite response regulator NarL